MFTKNILKKKGQDVSSLVLNPANLILLGTEWGVTAYCERKKR